MNTRRTLAVAAALAGAILAPAADARAQTAGFGDLPSTHWAAAPVAALAQAGIVKGGTLAPLAAGQAQKTPKAAYNGDKPVTRYELAATLYRFVTYIERADRQKKSKTGAWLQGEPKSGADAVKKLVAMGYLPKNTPLAKEGGKLVTANQMADALASVITKSRERTTPISKDSRLDIERPNHSHGSTPGT